MEGTHFLPFTEESNNHPQYLQLDHPVSIGSNPKNLAFSLETNKGPTSGATATGDQLIFSTPKSSSSKDFSMRETLYSVSEKNNNDNSKNNVVEVDEGGAVVLLQEYSGRERLKKHRGAVAGRVLIPEEWSQEKMLKEWMDYSSFDKLLAPTGIASARDALVAQGRKDTSQSLRVGITISRCS